MLGIEELTAIPLREKVAPGTLVELFLIPCTMNPVYVPVSPFWMSQRNAPPNWDGIHLTAVALQWWVYVGVGVFLAGIFPCKLSLIQWFGSSGCAHELPLCGARLGPAPFPSGAPTPQRLLVRLVWP
jgi:hypothetical protein